jgi:hypothetical protein
MERWMDGKEQRMERKGGWKGKEDGKERRMERKEDGKKRRMERTVNGKNGKEVPCQCFVNIQKILNE